MAASGAKQLSEVDPEARLLRKNGQSVVGYHGQIAVDDTTTMIGAVALVQDENDLQQLKPMMTQAAAATGNPELVGLADAGYASGTQLKGCVEKGMTMYVPIPKQAFHTGKDGRFGTDDFRYDQATDSYTCPSGQKLVRGKTRLNQRGQWYNTYRSHCHICRSCPLASRCLAPSTKCCAIDRWDNEDVMVRHHHRMATVDGVMRQRGAVVEHPFGTLKWWAEINFFLIRGLVKCRGELNLMTHCYHFMRALKEVKVTAFIADCQARMVLQGGRV